MAIDQFKRIRDVFIYMATRSRMVHAREYFGPGAPEGHVRIWTGHVSKISGEMNLPGHAAHQSVTTLSTLGCIRMAVRGTGRQESVYVIEQEPTEALWQDYAQLNMVSGRFEVPTKHQRNTDAINQLRKHINDLQLRLGRAEEKIERLEDK